MQTYLQDALGLDILAISLPSMASAYTSDGSLLEDVQGGRVYFGTGSVVPTTATLDTLAQNAFTGAALDDFLRVLQTQAESSLLRSTIYVQVIVNDADASSKLNSATRSVNGNNDNNSVAFEWTLPWIVIVVGGSAAAIAVSVLAYLLFSAKARRRAKHFSLRDLDLAKAASNDTPLTATGGGSHEEFRDNDDDEDCSDSDGTSIYSYKQHDDSSVSLAPSFLHAINERSALGAFYDTDEEKSPHAGLWRDGANSSPAYEALQNAKRPDSIVITPPMLDDDGNDNYLQAALQQRESNHHYQDDSNILDISVDQGDDGELASWMGGSVSQAGDASFGGASHTPNASLYVDDDEEERSALHKMNNLSDTAANQPNNVSHNGANFSNLWSDDEEKKDDLPMNVMFTDHKNGDFDDASASSSIV